MLCHAPSRHAQRICRLRGTNAKCRTSRTVSVEASQQISIPRWDAVYMDLKNRHLETVTSQEASELVGSEDWVLVDVRPGGLYDQAHPVGAASAPLYQLIDFKNATPTTWLRAALFAANGVQATEFNPKFIDQVKEVVASGKGVIVYCEAGGSIIPSMTFATGKASRSLQAAYRILNEGVTDRVKHLGGGIYGWYAAGLPMEGQYDTSNVGRTPNAAADAKFPSA